MIRSRVLVSGRVQGVYFRDSCRQLAVRQGVRGWVRNRPDGRVEAVFEGSADQVGQLVEWMRHGPDSAVVEDIEVHTEQPEGIDGFAIR
ncbi:acylphosphatase [Rugosimonospora africana]|uniref:Acylphosphatase n=1 Tax=Rugosimonospora africana TaxID=556532 RepID=A0A8J3VQJ6_9ACTN|nr:acylphosphatase [Rugosimonospora africana]GIH14398.1 acylphosphatase [Rugosimonospora africana]